MLRNHEHLPFTHVMITFTVCFETSCFFYLTILRQHNGSIILLNTYSNVKSKSFFLVLGKRTSFLSDLSELAPRFTSLQTMENKQNKSNTMNAERCKCYREKHSEEYRNKDGLRKSVQDWFWSPKMLLMNNTKERKGREKEPQNWEKTRWIISHRSIQPPLVVLLLSQEASRK